MVSVEAFCAATCGAPAADKTSEAKTVENIAINLLNICKTLGKSSGKSSMRLS
jgi:hypothetical protein